MSTAVFSLGLKHRLKKLFCLFYLFCIYILLYFFASPLLLLLLLLPMTAAPARGAPLRFAVKLLAGLERLQNNMFIINN